MQEVENLTARRRNNLWILPQAARRHKKLLQVKLSRSVCNAVLVVKMFSAYSQFIEHAHLFHVLTYEPGPGFLKAG